VKTVLACVTLALAVYQLVVIAVVYGKLRPGFLESRAAAVAHRTVGDSIALLILLLALMCLSYFEVEDGIEDARDGESVRAAVHVTAGVALLAVLGAKIVVIRWARGLGRFLPLLGIGVFALLLVTWLTSAADYLWWST
jgi:hypothetical protein